MLTSTNQTLLWSWMHLDFSSHTKTITKSAYYHLQYISRIEGHVSQKDLKKCIRAFFFSRLNDRNSVFTGQLRLIQNAAAWVLTRTIKVDLITPVIISLRLHPNTDTHRRQHWGNKKRALITQSWNYKNQENKKTKTSHKDKTKVATKG